MNEMPPAWGKHTQLKDLLPFIYQELRILAEIHMSRERPDHTLQPTALVHEVFLKFAQQNRVECQSRAQFLALASGAMRRILVDHARRRSAEKRSGGWQKVTLDEGAAATEAPVVDLIALDHALEKLEEADPLAAQIVQLRFFGGLTEVEAAEVLGLTDRTIRGRWAHARAWLKRELCR